MGSIKNLSFHESFINNQFTLKTNTYVNRAIVFFNIFYWLIKPQHVVN